MSTYLQERIEWYNDNYRRGTPSIFNAQFDKLKANLYRVNFKVTTLQKNNLAITIIS